MLIVGAGAAGLSAAITAARRGIKVTVLEQNSEPAKKIRVSGNGRCNIANRNPDPSRYHCSDPQFLKRALDGFDIKRIIKFFHSLGIELEEEDEGRLYPMGRQALSVVTLLKRESERLGVKLISKCPVVEIIKTKKAFRIRSECNEFKDSSVLLACGSPAAPQLGGNKSCMFLAKSLGHRLITPYPALVALESKESWPKRAAGVKLHARIKLYAQREAISQTQGDLLFTDYGVSGLAVLDLSREISLRLAAGKTCELSIDLKPSWSKERLNALLRQRIDKQRRLPLIQWLEGVLHRKIAPIILEKSNLNIYDESQLERKAIGRLVYTIKNLRLKIAQTRNFRYAEVATGGVDVSQVDPKTMESRLVKGLYFAGEILDVAGDRGGFNFHWAWTSGIRAGLCIR